MMARVMLIDAVAHRAQTLRRALTQAGHDIVARLDSAREIARRAGETAPDVIVIDVQAPDRDLLARLGALTRQAPRPVVMFTEERGRASIQDAVRAGVTAYIVDGFSEERVAAVIDVAIARFEQLQSLKRELDAAEGKLAERKLVERAKGILMRSRNLGEEEAYRALRKMAMDKNLKLAQVASHVIAVSELLAD